MEALETEMLAQFRENPKLTLVWKLENSFFRGILHGICQYHNLRSCSMSPFSLLDLAVSHVWPAQCFRS